MKDVNQASGPQKRDSLETVKGIEPGHKEAAEEGSYPEGNERSHENLNQVGSNQEHSVQFLSDRLHKPAGGEGNNKGYQQEYPQSGIN